ncbi:aldehyde dehydrogenase [Peniophora sp. CONT]|nr:aldehyde dehydrogenase [Peniophora sp. CONT]
MSSQQQVYARIQSTYASGKTRSLSWRRQQLVQIGNLVQENEEMLLDAIHVDLGKPRLESMVADLGPVVSFVVDALEHLEEWAASESVDDVPAWQANWGPMKYKMPKGKVLLISPWNYPYVISLIPLAGALAAGCTAVLKPSELAPTVSQALADLIPRYLDTEAVSVVQGGPETVAHLLEMRWDHIMFTGGTRIGRIVAQAAAKYLTPITLELGGKCPVVIDASTNLDLAARRILYGRQANAGQVCVSPDYVLVPRNLQDALIDALLKAAREFWPNGSINSDDLGLIINSAHRERLTNLLSETKGAVVLGGEISGERKLAMTILRDVEPNDVLMQEEIFGPIVPVLPIEDHDEAVRLINSLPIPLVVYLFSENDTVKQKFLTETESGTLVMNDTYQQLAIQQLPFGGKGDSGHGKYFGKYTFDLFTHIRSFVNIPLANEPFMQLRYPPYTQEAYDALSTFGMRKTLPAA